MSLIKNIRTGLLASAVVYGGAYLLFLVKVNSAESALERDHGMKDRATSKAQHSLDDHVAAYPWRRALKERYHLPDKTVAERTENVSVVFFNRQLEKDISVPEYWEALLEKIQLEEENEIVAGEIRDRLNSTLAMYRHARDLVASLDASRFAQRTPASAKCNRFYPGTVKLSINEIALGDATDFGKATAKTWGEALRRNTQQQAEYDKAMRKAQNGLPWSAFQSLQKESERSGILSSSDQVATFESPAIGTITYQLPHVSFNAKAFEALLARKYTTMYADNSLSTGNKPWAYCYGSHNHCGGNNCSEIQVRSGGSDVVVTIKDRRGEVVRHAYIKRNTSHSFNLPNGSYQPFFYYGKGWNPNKEMKYVACGMLKGGFISNEHVGKDDFQYLTNNILTYTLVETTFGNFNTRPSNTNEAL